jgi:hypothetical protein
MATFRSFPSHLKPMRGEGLITCAFSGFLRFPKDIIMIDGKPVAKDKADLYGAFGTDHPQDHAQPEIGGDPSPVRFGGQDVAKSKAELNISDQEVLAAIRENRPPRPGF